MTKKKWTADFVNIGNETATRHKYSSNIYFESYQVCAFDSNYFQLCQSDANSEKKQSRADHITVGSYHQRNKHWPVSLNNADENGDDEKYHDNIWSMVTKRQRKRKGE